VDGYVAFRHILFVESKYAKNEFYGMTWRRL